MNNNSDVEKETILNKILLGKEIESKSCFLVEWDPIYESGDYSGVIYNNSNIEKETILNKILLEKEIDPKSWSLVEWDTIYESGHYSGVIFTKDEQVFQFEIFDNGSNHFELVSWLNITESVYENIEQKGSYQLDFQQEKYQQLALLREINGTNDLPEFLNYEIVPLARNDFLREVVHLDYQHVYLIPEISTRLLHWWNQIEPLGEKIRHYKKNNTKSQKIEKISVPDLMGKLNNNKFIKKGIFFIQINREVHNLETIISFPPLVRYEKLKEIGPFIEVFLPVNNEYGRVVGTDKLYIDQYASHVDEKLFFMNLR